MFGWGVPQVVNSVPLFSKETEKIKLRIFLLTCVKQNAWSLKRLGPVTKARRPHSPNNFISFFDTSFTFLRKQHYLKLWRHNLIYKLQTCPLL